jgi:hypothetical protein
VAHVILAVGDMAGPADQNAGSIDTAALVTKLIAANPAALVLLLGDNAYNDGETGECDRFFKPVWGVEAIASRVCPQDIRALNPIVGAYNAAPEP